MSSSNPNYHQQCELPSRETEFRVCVNIHEARNLEGVDYNPVLRVACKCGQQVKKTKSVTGSINPIFNEVSLILLLIDLLTRITHCIRLKIFLSNAYL